MGHSIFRPATTTNFKWEQNICAKKLNELIYSGSRNKDKITENFQIQKTRPYVNMIVLALFILLLFQQAALEVLDSYEHNSIFSNKFLQFRNTGTFYLRFKNMDLFLPDHHIFLHI